MSGGCSESFNHCPCDYHVEGRQYRSSLGGAAARDVEPDEIVIEGIVSGHRYAGPLRPERRAAARILLRRRPDLTYGEVAEWVGVNRRTIERVGSRARN